MCAFFRGFTSLALGEIWGYIEVRLMRIGLWLES